MFELGGDVVEPVLADNLMRLIAEGAGQNDEIADTEMRSHAVTSYLAPLEKPQLPDILLQVITRFASRELSIPSAVMACSLRHKICRNPASLTPDF